MSGVSNRCWVFLIALDILLPHSSYFLPLLFLSLANCFCAIGSFSSKHLENKFFSHLSSNIRVLRKASRSMHNIGTEGRILLGNIRSGPSSADVHLMQGSTPFSSTREKRPCPSLVPTVLLFSQQAERRTWH